MQFSLVIPSIPNMLYLEIFGCEEHSFQIGKDGLKQ